MPDPRKPKSWMPRRLLVGVAVLLPLVLAASGADAAAACKKVDGKLTLTPVTSPACTSPVGVCAAVAFRGDLVGSGTFTGTSLLQTVDTPTAAVVLLTGDDHVTTKAGTLDTKDAIVLRTTGAGEFAEVDTVVGGTGEWAGATGAIRTQGTFSATAGGGGDYVGQLCTP
jgi:hypothetical protein